MGSIQRNTLTVAKEDVLSSLSLSVRAVNIRGIQNLGLTHFAAVSPAGLVASRDTSAGGSSVVLSLTSPPSCVPSLQTRYGLHRYYGRSDSCPASSSASLAHELWLCPRTGLPDSRVWPSVHSVSNHPTGSRCRFCTLPLSASGFLSPGLGFAIASQARHSRPAESSSLSYGLVVHLLLLPTPPRGDAVAVDYRPESAYLKRTLTSPTRHAFRRTERGRPARL
jgi:hypothetical protein